MENDPCTIIHELAHQAYNLAEKLEAIASMIDDLTEPIEADEEPEN